MKNLILLSAFFVWTFANAAEDTEKSFSSLGGNKILLDKAKSIQPEKEVLIVQKRAVSRRNRIELSPEFSGTFGGDTYVRSRSVGLNLNYHFTPRWSAGLKYNYSFNALTAEGDQMVETAYKKHLDSPGDAGSPVPDMDYQKDERLLLLNWYPVYGKLNFLDMGVAQFDFYFLAGAGQVKLSSGDKSTFTLGGGLGLWFTQNFSSRLELRYASYKAAYYTGDKNLDLAIASIQTGWMF